MNCEWSKLDFFHCFANSFFSQNLRFDKNNQLFYTFQNEIFENIYSNFGAKILICLKIKFLSKWSKLIFVEKITKIGPKLTFFQCFATPIQGENLDF